MITYLLRFLLLIVVFFFVKRIFTSLFSIGRQSNQKVGDNSGRNAKVVKREQVEKDPVCGMFVAREAAVILEDGGKIHYFCSEDCRDKFVENLKA